jgi:hypothetical protein
MRSFCALKPSKPRKSPLICANNTKDTSAGGLYFLMDGEIVAVDAIHFKARPAIFAVTFGEFFACRT